jgi:sulfoxide reductase heme-binding subunit YedZ
MNFSSSQTLWYLTRGSGLMALVVLTGSVALGVLTTAGWWSTRWPRFVTLGLHRNLSLLAVVLLVLHIATTIVDGFAPIGWWDAIIPFHSPYRRLWLGLGAVAVDLLAAVVVTSLLRRHLNLTLWRVVHWTTWAAWPVAVLHGLGTGSDTTHRWTQFVYVGCAFVVLASAWWRIATGWPAQRRLRTAAALASVLIPLAVLVWTVDGPLQHGWARRAGTPPSLVRPSSATQGP